MRNHRKRACAKQVTGILSVWKETAKRSLGKHIKGLWMLPSNEAGQTLNSIEVVPVSNVREVPFKAET